MIVVDLQEHLNSILQLGLYSFLKNHLENDLHLEFTAAKNDTTSFDEWLASKQVLVSLNKKDLIEPKWLGLLESNLDKTVLLKNQINVNRTASLNDAEGLNDITDLLGQLKSVLGKL